MQAMAKQEAQAGLDEELRLAARLHADFARFGAADAGGHGRDAQGNAGHVDVDAEGIVVREGFDRSVVNGAASDRGAGVLLAPACTAPSMHVARACASALARLPLRHPSCCALRITVSCPVQRSAQLSFCFEMVCTRTAACSAATWSCSAACSSGAALQGPRQRSVQA